MMLQLLLLGLSAYIIAADGKFSLRLNSFNQPNDEYRRTDAYPTFVCPYRT